MDESRGGFRVVDKRGAENDQPAQNPVPEPIPAAVAPESEAGSGRPTGFEEVNFVSFLLSLYSSALAAFGKVPDPATGKAEEHVEAGKQMIDILGILLEKTKGNLSSEEGQLLDNILYELRMIYLEKTQKIHL